MGDHIALDRFVGNEELRLRFGSNALVVYALQLRFGVDNPNELEDAVTDGEADKCCDVLYVHEPTGTAVIAQAYFATEPKDAPKVGKAADLNTAVSWVLDPSNRDRLQPPLKSAAELLDVALAEGSIETVELWYSHNCPETPDADEELQQAAKAADALLRMHFGEDHGIDVRPVQVGLETLDMWCAQSEFAILITDEIEVPAESYIEEAGDKWRAVCVSIPGDFLKGLLERYTPERLFSGNIREYLGRRRSTRNINFGIEQTAAAHPGDFWVYNNGITALVNKIEESGDRLRIRGITIVNGAQTTGALNRATKIDGVHVLARLVECSDAGVIEDIIRFNNTQNAIAPSDFRSRDAHQQRLRDEFENIPQVHYTGARRGVLPSSDSGVVVIESDEAAQALAAFHQSPELAYHGKSRIWEEDALYARFFNDVTTAAHIVYVVSLSRAIHAKKSALRQEADLRDRDRAALDFLAHRGAPYLLVAAVGKCQELILDRKVADSFSLSFGTEVSPHVGQELWAPVVDTVLAFYAVLLPATESGNIRLKDVREPAIEAFSANVDAFSNAADPVVFRNFAMHVIGGV